MSCIINASTSAGLVNTADTSGSIALQANGTTIATISSTGLTMNSGNIVVASTAAPTFSVYAANATACGASWTKVVFDTKEWDTNTNFNTSLGRFTPTVAGYYMVSAMVSLSNTTSYSNELAIYKNGSAYKYGLYPNKTTNDQSYNQITGLVYCNGSTDYIEIYSYQSSAQNTQTGSAACWFQGSMIRSA